MCARSMSRRMPERPSTAGTSFRSPRIASRRSIRRPAACSRRSRRRAAAAIGARLGRRDALGRAASRPQDPSGRSRDGSDSSHHRVQPLRHRRHLGRRRALARHLGRRRERVAAHRPSNRRGPGAARDAAWVGRVGARVRWRRSVLLRRRQQREGESRPPAQARLRGRRRRERPRQLHEQVIEAALTGKVRRSLARRARVKEHYHRGHAAQRHHFDRLGVRKPVPARKLRRPRAERICVR